ncbi:major facilitator superfamily domain-containing protein [Myxozyma melibiosi]|uniref:Major facilitator superfamily domain-containing protein n=1 Tax=Myxozyma melibiosi TaxID=54550 RepID=A0ABR1F0T4_9ASCO
MIDRSPSSSEKSQLGLAPEEVQSEKSEQYSGNEPLDALESPSDLDLAPEASSEKLENAEEITYPEGGRMAWTVAFGSWCAMFASFGLWNSLGIFESYLCENQLSEYSSGTVSWIFSVYSFLFYFCGLQVGPIYDKYGLQVLVSIGFVGLVVALMMFSLCTEYYQFFLSFGVLGGISCSMIFTPSIAVVSQWFHARRGVATGLVCTGGSLGGIVFPMMTRSLLPQVGYGWSIRIMAFIVLFMSVCSVLCMKTRLERKSGKSAMMDLRMFKDRLFAATALGNFMIEWALQIPATYFMNYAISQGVTEDFGYGLVAIMNAASVFGRFIPGYYADKYGAFNLLVITVALCGLFNLTMWLPIATIDKRNIGGQIAYLICFGFASGTGISLVPVCFAQICDIRNYGKTYGTAYTLASIATLTGTPIAGAILKSMDNHYAGLVGFCGACYVVATVLLVFARCFGSSSKLWVVY